MSVIDLNFLAQRSTFYVINLFIINLTSRTITRTHEWCSLHLCFCGDTGKIDLLGSLCRTTFSVDTSTSPLPCW